MPEGVSLCLDYDIGVIKMSRTLLEEIEAQKHLLTAEDVHERVLNDTAFKITQKAIRAEDYIASYVQGMDVPHELLDDMRDFNTNISLINKKNSSKTVLLNQSIMFFSDKYHILMYLEQLKQEIEPTVVPTTQSGMDLTLTKHILESKESQLVASLNESLEQSKLLIINLKNSNRQHSFCLTVVGLICCALAVVIACDTPMYNPIRTGHRVTS